MFGAERYEWKRGRRAYRNGHYTRNLLTRYGLIDDIRVPRPARGGCEFSVFDRYERRRRDLDAAIDRLFLSGISTRKLKGIARELYGQEISPQTVSTVSSSLDAELARFQDKPIDDTIEFLFLDGISQKVREIGIERKVMLCAFGIHQKRDGEAARRREILSFQLTDVEDEASGKDSSPISKDGGLWENILN